MAVLQGKSAVVTGSTSGIGLGIARALAGAGAQVVLNGSRAPNPAIHALRELLERDFGVRAIYCSADLSDAAQVGELIAVAEREFGARTYTQAQWERTKAARGEEAAAA